MSAVEKEVLRRLPTKLREQWLIGADEDFVGTTERASSTSVSTQGWARAAWSVAAEYYAHAFQTTAAARVAGDWVFVTTGTETEPNSPFDSLVAAKAARAKRAIAGAAGLGAIYRRLDNLVDLAKDEYPATEIPDADSLASAISFFTMVEGLSKPLLGLTSAGNVWAEWFKRRDRQERVALEFRRGGSITLAATFRDPSEPLRRSSAVHGNLSARNAAERLRADIALRWVITTPPNDG